VKLTLTKLISNKLITPVKMSRSQWFCNIMSSWSILWTFCAMPGTMLPRSLRNLDSQFSCSWFEYLSVSDYSVLYWKSLISLVLCLLFCLWLLWSFFVFRAVSMQSCRPATDRWAMLLWVAKRWSQASTQTYRPLGVNGSSADNLSDPLNLDHSLVSFITSLDCRFACQCSFC